MVGRTSSFQFKGKTEDSKTIGEKLGVYYLLEGSVRRSADRVRIAVGLVKAGDGANVWSETYDRELKDIFAVQSEIAGAVAKELKVALLGNNGQTAQLATAATPSNQNVEAYNALLQGNFYSNRRTAEDNRKAIGYYEEAIRLDPRYALAYAKLSIAAVNLASSYGECRQQRRTRAIAKARASAKRALELDPNLADAHSAQGGILTTRRFQFRRRGSGIPPRPRARAAESRRDRESRPPCCHTWPARRSGRTRAAGKCARAVTRRIPLQPRAISHRARPLRRGGGGAAQGHRIAAAVRSNYQYLAMIQVLRGNPGTAVDLAKQETDPFWRTYALALAHFATGDRAETDAALKKLIDENADDGASQIARVYALRKDPEKMFEWLEHGWTTHDGGVTELLYNPFLLAYKDDPRFIAFARKVGVMPKVAPIP